MNQDASKRVNYIDVVKFLGMLAIYCGHYLTSAGNLYPFIFAYHVPLFFFLAGCTEHFGKKRDEFLPFLLHKVKTILLPWLFFALGSLAFSAFYGNGGLRYMAKNLIFVAKGCVRNTYLASGLWFLTCIFVMSLLFFFIKKLKRNGLILAGCTLLFVLFCILNTRTDLAPSTWYFNAGSALYYLIFYGIGYCVFPFVHSLLESKRRSAFVAVGITATLALAYASLLYFRKDALIYLFDLLGMTAAPFRILLDVVRPLILIWLNFVVGYYLLNNRLLAKLGSNSLYLCGNEFFVKLMIPELLGIFNIPVRIDSPITAIAYSFAAMLLVYVAVIPFEKRVIEKTAALLRLP